MLEKNCHCSGLRVLIPLDLSSSYIHAILGCLRVCVIESFRSSWWLWTLYRWTDLAAKYRAPCSCCTISKLAAPYCVHPLYQTVREVWIQSRDVQHLLQCQRSHVQSLHLQPLGLHGHYDLLSHHRHQNRWKCFTIISWWKRCLALKLPVPKQNHPRH